MFETIELFDVKVDTVRTLNVKPKKTRMGQYDGFKSGYKKAMVKLADGHTIDIFEER